MSPDPARPRNLVFGEDAESYDAARPTYPPGVVDLLVQGSPADGVDVGCGTGKAARLVAARGVAIEGLEPDARMAEIARRHGIPVTVTTIEEWDPTPCDLLYAGQAWHWVQFDVAAQRAAGALRSGGRWAAFWNDELDSEPMATVHSVYREVAPYLIIDRARHEDRAMYAEIVGVMKATDAFEPVGRADVRWTDDLDAGVFVRRLSTKSGHRLLAPDLAHRLHTTLLDALGGPSTPLTIPYRTVVLTTLRR